MRNTFVCLLLGTALSAFQAWAACPNTVTDFNWVGAPGHVFTAAVVNPTGPVSGDVDATGCDIGIYYSPSNSGGHSGVGYSTFDFSGGSGPGGGWGGGGNGVNGASVHSAKYFGIVNNGARVNITNSTVYDIGDNPISANQYGIGVYFNFQSNASGSVSGNTIWNYQLAGIVISGPKSSGNVTNNTVVGTGPISINVQTGIQVGYGTDSDVTQNIVVSNSYSGTNDSAGTGILVVGGSCYGGAFQTGSHIDQNVAVGNDVGIWMVNLDSTCLAPTTTKTNDEASQNTIRNNAYPPNNTENGGYQSGITDEGNGDLIQNNSICGVGLVATSAWPYLLYIDTNFTNNVTVKNTTTCSTTSPITSAPHTPPHHNHWAQ